MADSKERYSVASHDYVERVVPTSELDRARFDRSKARERLYNDNWQSTPVNINEICSRFTPGSTGRKKGYKFEFKGERYTVIADMPAGYLRIFDRVLKRYVRLDGTPGTPEETHFKLKKREEM